MVVKIGVVFLTCAMGPVRFAAAAIQASRMPQGIEEIAPELLRDALRRGIGEAAKLAGVKPQDVERILPMKDLQDCLAQLGPLHAQALQAWATHAGQLGGLLTGVADLTVDGREVLPSSGLSRIARKVRRDAPLAEPVQALADEMQRWEDLLDQSKKSLDTGAELAQAYRRRRIRNVAIAAVSAAAALAVLVMVLIVIASRMRIDDALESKDVCAVAALAATDVGRSSSKQKVEVEARKRGCEAQRAAEAFATDALKRHEEDTRLAAQLQADLEAKCEAMADRIASGKVSQEDLQLAGPHAKLIGRIRLKALTPADLGPTMPTLPCEGTGAQGKLRDAFAAAAMASIWNWIGGIDPADEVRDLLAPRALEMSERGRMTLGVRASEVAKRAIRQGNAEGIHKAKRLCVFAEAMQVPGGDPCEALKGMPDEKK